MDPFDEELWAVENAEWSKDPPDRGSDGTTETVSDARGSVIGLGATPFVAGNGYARRFPTDRLPEPMRHYCHDLAFRKQVPVDLVALTMLGILGAVAGPRLVVRRDLDWSQPCNLYTCCGLPSGAGKSPTIEELRRGVWRALKRLADRQDEKVGAQIGELDQNAEDLYMRANHVQTPIGEREGLRLRAKAIEREVEELRDTPPGPPQIMFDGDISVEALAAKLADNEGAGAIIDDEGTFLRMLGGMYSGGRTGNLGLVLVGYDCRSYAPARVTRTSQPIDRAALSLVIAPQPGIIADMLRDQSMIEAGVINRFLLAVPGDLIGQREDRPATYYKDLPTSRPDRSGREWWAKLIESIAEYDVIGATDLADAATIDLTRGAFKRHREYEREFEERLHPGTGNLLAVAAWGSKHLGRIIRVAALLHLAAGHSTDDELSESVMEDAIAIGEWSIEHFLAAGKASGLSEDAGRIKEFVDNTEFGCALRSEINKRVFANKAPKTSMSRWINELVETGDYELRQMPTRGRPGWALCRAGITIPSRNDADDL
jgi:replicative DNA helicase